ncbi:cysteine desulfurase [Candidatus Borkfalkia ceftriaxoniphila]|uniref:cysteine desulfurase n=1 Tax=Candidatus Borkfalkia ceftriaxoniphila TaxID=2508949 RepID=A0A4Q2K9Z3_9FIRM|nr:cysteine desulfurase family protein [Candidatus Borkfalkia ceftriaxoniphila]RXZ61375.1 cysteine desulfurase [Candidatus Borkfalkia ceftriaxoniphila]
MKRIYLDHAATTGLDAAVLSKMAPYFSDIFGNANSQHSFGREAVRGVDEARDTIASLIGAKPNEIYFTSGGTEADNWAIRGAAHANRARGNHLIVSAVEHPAMLTTARELEKEGFEVTLAPVDEFGTVDVAKLEESIRPETVFIGVMAANNEIGTLQPLAEISEIAQKHKILFFTDAVQAAGAIPLDVNAPRVDMMSISGHKFYGPKGVGALYIRSGVKTGKILTGGHQERGMRGGTTNVPGVVGMAEALRLAVAKLDENAAYISSLRDRFIARVQKEIPFVKLNGHPKNRLPSNANFSFRYVEGESLLFSLDLAGIAVSSGSACSSGSLEPSHVLLATGMSEGLAHGSLRFSFGRENTAEDVDYTVDKLKEIVVKLRNLSPLFPKDMKNEVFEKGE